MTASTMNMMTNHFAIVMLMPATPPVCSTIRVTTATESGVVLSVENSYPAADRALAELIVVPTFRSAVRSVSVPSGRDIALLRSEHGLVYKFTGQRRPNADADRYWTTTVVSAL